MRDLDTISWREFCVLLRGLSSESNIANIMHQKKEQREKAPKKMPTNMLASFLKKELGTRKR